MKAWKSIVGLTCVLAAGTAWAAEPPLAGTVVPLQFDQSVSSRQVQPGEPVAFRVYRDVVRDGRVVIPRGTMVQGKITGVERPGTGKPAKLTIVLRDIWNVDGRRIELESPTSGGLRAAGGGLLIVGPPSAAGGVLARNAHIDISDGTRINVLVSGSQKLWKRDKLPPVEQPLRFPH